MKISKIIAARESIVLFIDAPDGASVRIIESAPLAGAEAPVLSDKTVSVSGGQIVLPRFSDKHDCLYSRFAVLNGDTASIIVKSQDLQAAEIAQINAIVYEQAGIVPGGVTIITK